MSSAPNSRSCNVQWFVLLLPAFFFFTSVCGVPCSFTDSHLYGLISKGLVLPDVLCACKWHSKYCIYSCKAHTSFLDLYRVHALHEAGLRLLTEALHCAQTAMQINATTQPTINTFTVTDWFFVNGLVPSCSSLRELTSTRVCVWPHSETFFFSHSNMWVWALHK